jgi:membrane-associated protein
MEMFNVSDIIQAGGLLLIALIIFGESGMFFGFFFPGDTLLLSAGVFAAQGKLDIATLLPVVALAAIIGDNIGYLIGKHYGRHLFDRPNSIIFKREYLRQAEAFFNRYGSRAMLIAHFVPVVRTFAPAAAGISRMNHKKFIFYDAIGDTVWAVLVTMIGYWFGSRIPNIDHYILLAVAAVMLITLGPALYHLAKALLEKRRGSSTLDN